MAGRARFASDQRHGVRMSHGAYVDEFSYICERVMAHTWMSYGTQVNMSWYICESVMHQLRVMVTMRMSHGTYVDELWHMCQ